MGIGMWRGLKDDGALGAGADGPGAANLPSLFEEQADSFRFLAITPFDRPDLRLARALHRHEAATAIALGPDPAAWPQLFENLKREAEGFGLYVSGPAETLPAEPPPGVRFVIVSGSGRGLPAAWRRHPVVSQVCSVEQAEQALLAGASGLIAQGQESGGDGSESSFVLLQRLVGLAETLPKPVPVWCQGGMGLHTAAGAIAGGAFGVVLDNILAGYPECSLAPETRARILALDGSTPGMAAGSPGQGSHDSSEPGATGAGEPDDRWPLAVGQDAALASLALAECANLEALIKTLRQRVSGHLLQARRLRVLDEGNRWAEAHGTRYPIAQGPMTRVSDTAAFAAAVSEAGGLPFLALSLMRGDAVRSLLEETRASAGTKPWGVGVLGFAPAEILEPQLELVREFRPSALLLAGGRPSQARPFVDMGIPTYLHVPSPGLLDLFLKDGATHFVFEGRECGGHVGPRYSFVLWEQAVTQLMRHKHPERLHILFAGGIHDARSSAMVAAIAAPLAARGAKVGVLMGTAYIATEEAVATGAVLPRFQEKALSGAATTLVETAPGHAIRCVASSFIDLFETEKSRMREAGMPQKEIWAALEALTVGRLRVASKGLDYVDGVLSPVEVERQDAEGMYMIGQIVALKRTSTRIDALHADVSRGATEYLERIEIPRLRRAAAAEPVAIVGMACVYPGSPDLETYWTNIVEGGDFIREVPAQRWSADRYWRPAPAGPDKTPSKWGGFVDEVPFDPVEYGIPPQSLRSIEPAQLLSLETARKALEDAGYSERWFDREKTAVIFGAESPMDLGNQYSFRNMYAQYCGEMSEALAHALPALTEDSFAGVLSNVISGRIANRLGLGGVNYSVDSACASSLTAIELGVKELRGGSSDMVLAGGADFHNGISDFLMFASVGALSPTGRCRPFDSHADGIALGEGVGVVVLKRLSDAERDGDRIYAVIDSVAGSSDGKALGLTAPRREGQRRALDRAYWQAGVLPGEIGLVEAHGTGTVVGDRTELESLTEQFQSGGAVRGQARLGSVKSQIGHTKCAAGIAGVIKVAKALHHRVLPATQQITAPNPAYRETGPFRLSSTPSPWLAGAGETPRAAVSAFGFGGTNFHAVLSAYGEPSSRTGAVVFPAELFAIRGVTSADADNTLRRLQKYVLASDAPASLRDLALSAWTAGSGPVQVAFVAQDIADLGRCLAAALQRRDQGGVHFRQAAHPSAKMAALFSGQGSQYPQMFAELFVYFPGVTHDLAATAPEILPALFPPSAYDGTTRRAQERQLADTRFAQPALGLVEYAAFRWLQHMGVRPDMAAGHSYGELVALAAAGAFDFAGLMQLSHARAGAMVGSAGGDAGIMAAVRMAAPSLEPLLSAFPDVVVANRNSPIQTVIAGPSADVHAACAFLTTQSVGWKVLDTDRAFHSPLMGAARSRFTLALAQLPIASPGWPVYSNVTAAPHEAADTIRANLADHLVSPVRFMDEIEQIYADGARVFLEIGPRKVLAGLVGQILKGRPHTVLALDAGEKGLAGLLGVVSQLAVLLPDFDATPLYDGRASAIDLDHPRKFSGTTWLLNGGGARPLNGAPQPAMLPIHPAAVTPPRAMPAGEEALVAYLSNMREMVRAQRDVLVGYFGASGSAPMQAAAVRAPARFEIEASPPPVAHTTLPAVEPAPVHDEGLETQLLRIISDRTGYPADRLDADLDLEADLSIDSIKRIEIIGELGQRLGLRERLGADADALLEKLASQKTLRAMLGLLSEHVPADEGAATSIAVLLPQIVSETTGYPIEALDLDLDLEADLSIDSIKRLEIVGKLMARRGMDQSGDKDAVLDHLSSLKTLRAMISWLDAHLDPAAANSPAAAPIANASLPLRRYVLRQRDAQPVVRSASDLAGQHFLITDDGLGIAPLLAAALEDLGAYPRVVDFNDFAEAAEPADRVDGLVHLWSLNPASRVCDVKRFFAIAREALLAGLSHLLVAGAGSSASRGGGFAGMVRTLSKEFPALRARCLDLDPSEAATALAGYVELELLADEPIGEVSYQAGRRQTRDVVAAALDAATSGAPLLDRDSVVLLTGGARGITAGIAVALAQRYRCHLELAGRSELPVSVEDAATRGIEDPILLRQALVAANPALRPAQIESLRRRLQADREITRTLDLVRKAGGSARYTQVDVSDDTRFAAFIAEVYERNGRIDGVVHGAGVIEDKLVRDKTPESFNRVFDTKVNAAMVLRRLIRDDVRFVVFFSSVASAFGNRGQVDYASANDVLDKVARSWNARVAGRVVSVNWGPWADTGMVSDSLRDEYLRRGIGLIPQSDGIDALFRELSMPIDEAQVVLMCGTPESFGAASPAVAGRA